MPRHKKVSAPSRRGDISIDIPFYRTFPSAPLSRQKDYSPTCERRVTVRLAESPLLESLVAWQGISPEPSPPSKRRFSAPPVKSISSIAASTADSVRTLPCEDSI